MDKLLECITLSPANSVSIERWVEGFPFFILGDVSTLLPSLLLYSMHYPKKSLCMVPRRCYIYGLPIARIVCALFENLITICNSLNLYAF